MPWTCRFLENPPMDSHEIDGKRYHYVDTKQLRVGDMWYARDDQGQILNEEARRKRHLTAQYWASNSHRPPIIVLLPTLYSSGPGVQEFCVDGQCYDSGRGHYDGWTVTGAPPAITVNPSINMTGHYHGWLRDGQITEDCEGRKFEGLPR